MQALLSRAGGEVISSSILLDSTSFACLTPGSRKPRVFRRHLRDEGGRLLSDRGWVALACGYVQAVRQHNWQRLSGLR